MRHRRAKYRMHTTVLGQVPGAVIGPSRSGGSVSVSTLGPLGETKKAVGLESEIEPWFPFLRTLSYLRRFTASGRRAEFFNAFNTPQFANPDRFLGDGDFGKITSTNLPNRELQFDLKYKF
jgi:hypothetical protein